MNTANKEFYSSKYDINKESELKNKLSADGFIFKSIDHAFWSAQKNGITVTLYKSGKILAQGKNTEEFVEQFLENSNQRLAISSKNQTPVQTKLEIPKPKIDCWIGTDESGKGDYFGPLVVAGVLVDQENIKKFQEINVRDCKKINDVSIEKLAWQIKANSIFSVVTINPNKYNQLYAKFNNLNNLLAWGHARAIENILEKKECKNAISDKFGNESLIKNALMTHGKTINLEQRHKAEDDIAVAAASILARNEFLQRMKKMSQEYGINFQKGASEKVKEQARLFIEKYGFESLSQIAKMHFKTTLELKK
ncbi:MAG: ribonuclease HIII [Candidatus Melainabacteria bacterium RIFOXYA2_FULL_32_9]|nr:MAG: ribonuclease HIII [Candidatus Melainabacteria bacterium RIFOXYA2_FULL_32_9]